ncbi:MAG: heme o synthase [bacterium]
MVSNTNPSDWLSLTKPRIVFLLCISGVGAVLASGGTHPVTFLGFTVSLALIAASASVMNCYYDRHLDTKMERTQGRPLPSGRIEPLHALIFGLLLLTAGTVLGAFVLPARSLVYLLLGFASYVFLYTVWLKRTHWMGVVLGGSAGSFPVLAGWTVTGPLTMSGFLMAFFVFAWTPAHAWALEFVFRDQYETAGIPTYPVVKTLNETANGLTWAAVSTVLAGAALIPFTGPLYDAILIGSTPMFLFSYYMFYRDRGENEAVHAFFSANLYLTFLFVGWALDGFLGQPGWMGLYLLALTMPPSFIWIWRSRPSLGPVEASVDWANDTPVPSTET